VEEVLFCGVEGFTVNAVPVPTGVLSMTNSSYL